MAEKDFVVKNGLVVNTAFSVNSTAIYYNDDPIANSSFFFKEANTANVANLAVYIVPNTGIVSNSSGVFVNSQYINTISSNLAYYVVANNGIVSNSSGVFVNSSNSVVVNSAGVFVNANSGLTVDSSGLFVNANNGIVSNSSGVFVKANSGIVSNSSGVFVKANSGIVSNSSGIFVNANNGVISNSSGVFVNANNGVISNSSGVFVNANNGIVSNTSGVFVNTDYIATLTADNANKLNGQLPSYYTNATNITTGTLSSARLSGSYTGITNVGTQAQLTVSGNTNIDSGVFFVDTVNNLVAVGTTSPNTKFHVVGDGRVTNDLYVEGDLIISGNTVTSGETTYSGNLNPEISGTRLGNTTNRWYLSATYVDVSNTITIANTVSGVSVTINSTSFSGTANNALYLGGTIASAYQLNSTLAANVQTLTANNSNNLGGQLPSYYLDSTNLTGTIPYARLPVNVVNTTSDFTFTGRHTHNANVILGSSGLSANGSFGTSGHVLHSNGTATYWAADDQGVTSVSTGNGLSGGPITSTGTISVIANNGVVSNSSGVFVKANTGIVANTLGVFVNASYIATLPANNTTYLNGQLSSYYTNATNISTGTLSSARLPQGTDLAIGGLKIVDSVSNTSAQIAASANSVKTAYDAAISANTRAASAQTAAASAYTNAVAISSNATNLTNGTVPSARISGAYTGITQVGTLSGIAVSGNSNFDSGVLFVDGTNNKVGVNTSSPSVSLTIAANDAIQLPSGNTANRPTPQAGMIRYNNESNLFEGYSGGQWAQVTGTSYYKGNLGTIGFASNKGNLYKINSNTQTVNVTIEAGENALTAGPIVVADGYNLTVETGGRVVIV